MTLCPPKTALFHLGFWDTVSISRHTRARRNEGMKVWEVVLAPGHSFPTDQARTYFRLFIPKAAYDFFLFLYFFFISRAITNPDVGEQRRLFLRQDEPWLCLVFSNIFSPGIFPTAHLFCVSYFSIGIWALIFFPKDEKYAKFL